jgi:PPK2 family polyphosphate:nucleotide phosphotransferase
LGERLNGIQEVAGSIPVSSTRNDPAPLVHPTSFDFEESRMSKKAIIRRFHDLAKTFRVTDGKGFRLKDVDPGETLDFQAEDKPLAKEALASGINALAELQDKLYAQDRWAVLLIFQALDAAGKDGTIKHVMSGVNPQGCEVVSFKSPSAEELDHDYLWRCVKNLPQRGRIGIFNRSYYEETLVVRVHPELLSKQKLPPEVVTKSIWRKRFQDIRCFERYLTRNGVVIRKFFLHVSKAQQKKRFLERLENPEKNWKFSADDVREREFWDDYQDAYEDTIRRTATKNAPWYVVPADNKWFTRLIVAAAIVETLGSLGLRYPKVDKERLEELGRAREALLGRVPEASRRAKVTDSGTAPGSESSEGSQDPRDSIQ